MKNCFNRAQNGQRKIVISIWVILSALIFSACQGPQGVPGPVGPTGQQGEGVNWKVIDDITVDRWDYSTYTDNNYYFAKYDVEDLTDFVFMYGNVQGYIYTTESGETCSRTAKGAVQHALPYVLHISTVDSEGYPYTYTRTIDFVFGVKWLQFVVRESDFAYEGQMPAFVPEKMDFRIVMTW